MLRNIRYSASSHFFVNVHLTFASQTFSLKLVLKAQIEPEMTYSNFYIFGLLIYKKIGCRLLPAD